MNSVFRLFVFVALLVLVLGAIGASYWGFGARPLGAEPRLRAGSVGGPRVVGGGPRSGK